MEAFEPQTSIMTEHEIYTRLVSASAVVSSEGIGHRVEKELWEYIDFLLDTMLDLRFIDSIVTD